MLFESDKPNNRFESTATGHLDNEEFYNELALSTRNFRLVLFRSQVLIGSQEPPQDQHQTNKSSEPRRYFLASLA